MPDISKVNGVEVGNISKVDNVEVGNADTLLSGSFPAQQSDPAHTSLTNEDFDSGRAYAPAVAYDTTNSVMAFCYGDGNNSQYPSVTCATASGTTLTYGDTVVLDSTGGGNSHGICYNNDENRFMGVYEINGTSNNYNTLKAFAAGVATSGSGSPKIENVATATIYDPHATDGSSNYNGNQPEGNMCIYDHSDGASAGRMLVGFNKGGPSSGSSVAGNRFDIVGCAVTITDVSSNNNLTIGALSVLAAASGSHYGDFLWSWNEQRNKVVLFSQDVSGTYQIQARTVTGSGATLTLGTNYLLDTGSANIMSHNNGGENGSSESRFRLDNSKRAVYDSTNNCHHVFIWDDTYDDFHLFNCTVAADDTITWTQANGSPVRSNGIIAQYGNIFTQGASSGWGTSSYNTLGLAFSSGRGRGAVFGNDGTSHSSAESHVAGFVYSPTTGYNFTGTSFQVFENKPKTQVTSPSGHHHISDDGFVGKNLFFVGRNQDSDGMSEIMAFDAGVGQRTASAGIFSAGNGTLSTARSRCNGFGTSRIACIVVGGTSSAPATLNSGEEYNGSAVTAAGDTLSATKNQPGSCGTLTAGLVQGGNGYLTSDEYDGNNFTSGGTASTVGGDGSRAAGLQTDALVAGGYVSSYRDDSESYNGISFATEGDTPGNVNYGGMAGTGHEDAYYFGGYPGSVSAYTYKYNGASWSTLNSMSNGRYSYQGGGTGEDFLLTGGNRTGNNDGEIWNGTSWAACATNGLSSHDLYSGSPDTDCGGTSTLVSFGGGTDTGQGSAQTKIVHHDR
tara:strand:- start:487 stop:2847 length:2361 start_codon:yes stop_codon:yes gene_type:complete